MSMHECMWPGCSKKVPSERWGCGEHWRALPEQIRTEIYRSYIPGQTASTALPDYHRAVARAQQWVVQTFGGAADKHDPGRWARLVSFVRDRDAARAARRAAMPTADATPHLRLVP